MRLSFFPKSLAVAVLFLLLLLAGFFFCSDSPEPHPHILGWVLEKPTPPLPPPPLPSPETAVPSPPGPSLPLDPSPELVPQDLASSLRDCIRTCTQEALLQFMAEHNIELYMRWRENRVSTVFDNIIRIRPETALYLLQRGDIIMARHPQALSSAVISGNKALVELLLAMGADPNGHGADGPSPYLLSVVLGQVAIMDLLESLGSRNDPVYNRKNAMDWAARSPRTRVSNLRRLVEDGFTIESHHVETAVRHGNLGVLAFMLKQRPELRNLRDKDMDILSLAIQSRRPLSMIRYLHRSGSVLKPAHLDLALQVQQEALASPNSHIRSQAAQLEAIILYLQEEIP